MRKGSDRALAALLALEDAAYSSSKYEGLPTLDERVELYLRAIHGSELEFSDSERAMARMRILDAAAANLTGDISASRYDDTETINAEANSRSQKRAMWRELVTGLLETLLLPIALASAPPARLAVASLGVVLLAGAGWAGAWLYGARSAETAIASWVDGEAKAGRAYHCGSHSVGGFPSHIEIRCTEASAQFAAGATVDAKVVQATASILRPGVLDVEISGPVSISDRGQPLFLANWTSGHVRVAGQPSKPERITIAVDNAQFYAATQTSMQPILTGESLNAEASRNPSVASGQTVLDFSAHVAGGYLPSSGIPLSQTFVADATGVVRRLPEGVIIAGARQLREWQANGGDFQLKSARIQQGDAVAVGGGNVRLNGSGQVDGALQVAVTGPYVRFAESLAHDAAERNKVAESLQTGSHVRGLEPGPQPSGANAVSPVFSPTDLHIRFVNGSVYLGPVLIGTLPPLY